MFGKKKPRRTPAPLWDAFMVEATGGDAEFSSFLQRLAGYSLTGHVTEEVLAFLYGPGGNGKGSSAKAWAWRHARGRIGPRSLVRRSPATADL